MRPVIALPALLCATLATVPLGARRPLQKAPATPAPPASALTSFDGTIAELTPMMGRGMGLKVTLDTKDGTRVVHLGPSAWLESKGLKLAKGDAVTVKARQMAAGGEWIAHEVTKGEIRVQLRDDAGRPLWRSRGPMRPGGMMNPG
ncbi:MAG TPA: hypothetical protein VFT46_07965 [Holophagaceae bacterium]|nr:hypothetical protein [Holophagaceae bacterium]